MKICIVGCGLRTPLLIHGIAHSSLNSAHLALYDISPGRAELMSALGEPIAAQTPLKISTPATLPDAIRDSSFVISSIRPGGMEARARDEQIALECGFAGQETTGPGGFAMAIRTVPIALEHARLVERLAPEAWIVNFTNPAGIITQAISSHTGARVIGICDTPAELFFRISLGLGKPLDEVECDYFGLNHLGWVDAVRVRTATGTEDCTDRILNDDELLRSLYSAPLFSPQLIRSLRLIPTEYLYFYYNQRTARANQLLAGATRAKELIELNKGVIADLERSVHKGDPEGALRAYRRYLNRRNSSYMHLEGEGKSAFVEPEVDWNPFEGATGYHRIAVDAIQALCAGSPSRMVLNVTNHGAIQDLAPDDVVEVPCLIDRNGPRHFRSRSLPESARGLTISAKYYERLAIRAALSHERSLSVHALFSNPSVGDWQVAANCVDKLFEPSQV
jgi:6-phospho-beta-glucosidase